MIRFTAADADNFIRTYTPGINVPYPYGTVCFWVRRASTGGNQMIFRMDNEYKIQFETDNKLHIWLHRHGAKETLSSVLSSTTALYHVACTYYDAGATQILVYVDGTLDVDDTDNDSQATDGTFYVGFDSGSYGSWFDGELGDFRFYDRRLSAAEISTIHACKGHDGIRNGLVHRWMMNDKADGVAVGGHGGDLTVRDTVGGSHMAVGSGTPYFSGSECAFRRMV